MPFNLAGGSRSQRVVDACVVKAKGKGKGKAKGKQRDLAPEKQRDSSAYEALLFTVANALTNFFY
jgi:hypothetical protein